MFTLLANSWCPERSFLTKTISSSLFGEYKFSWVILIRWIPILVIISYVKTFYVLQNQSFFRLFFQFCVFLVTVTCSLLQIMSLRWLLIFSFCKISLPRTSRYVLIDISNLTHFLCRNLFVMSCLTQSVNSDFRECFGNLLTITVNYSIRMVNAITNTLQPLATVISENVLKIRSKLPCGTPFCEDCYPFNPPLWATAWRSGGCFSEFCECSQKSRSLLPYSGPLGFLTTKYHDILMFVWGRGTLAKAKRRGKEKKFK